MSTSDPSQKPLSPDDLPPVQPPSAGFLVQLFLIPGIIVAIIVLVWLSVDWLAHQDNDPKQYVDGLRRDTQDVWQKAENLAELLRNDRGELKNNGRLAAELAAILNERLDAAKMDDGSINLRLYLSSALGQFNAPDGLPTLIKAASTQRDDKELVVRRAALDAIGILLVNVKAATAEKSPNPAASLGPAAADLRQVLSNAARDPEPVIRLRAAYVLGIIGGDGASERLVKLLDDPSPDVSYNAATALARHGDVRCIDRLLEMLSPDQSKAVQAEEKNLQDEKRTLILVNGLRAVELLVAANPTADLSRLQKAVDELRGPTYPLEVRDAALADHALLAKQAR
jgi:hypothetical protein